MKKIRFEGNMLIVQKEYLQLLAIVSIIIIGLLYQSWDSPFDKAMNELDKSELEMDKANGYIASRDYTKAEMAFNKSMEYIDNAADYLEGEDLSKEQESIILNKSEIIIAKGIKYAFGIGFGPLFN